jgi:hypothetical protein
MVKRTVMDSYAKIKKSSNWLCHHEISIEKEYYNEVNGKVLPLTFVKAQKGTRVIALPSENLGARWQWVFTARS